MSTTPQARDSRAKLVALLRQAAQVEHTLACSYLFAGCSMMSTPQEFAELPGGSPNIRRAIQFERARTWKMKIQTVAVEEMLHLHYVQCLLRALGEPPCFDLPERSASGRFIFKDWLDVTTGVDPTQAPPVIIGIDPFSKETIDRFVAYESNDLIQDIGGFTGQLLPMLLKMNDLEREFHIESMLLAIPNPDVVTDLREKLKRLYAPPPSTQSSGPVSSMPIANLTPAQPKSSSAYQSITNLYMIGILPLYKKAFESGWVMYGNRRLDDELLDPNYAGMSGGRLLPIGPISSPNRFGGLLQKSVSDPLKHFKDVEAIIDIIVHEGEGAGPDIVSKDVIQTSLLGHPDLIQSYLRALLAAGGQPPVPLPANVVEGEMLRQSHLYRFAMIMAQLDEEQQWAKESKAHFGAARETLSLMKYPELQPLVEESVIQFNACYLVVVAWMSRVYEIRNWTQDTNQRKAIEMMGSWTLMSLAIRPLLELMSFLPVSRGDLFSADPVVLPDKPEYALNLLKLYKNPERTQTINLEMDHQAGRVLSSVAQWAVSRQSLVENSSIPPHSKQMMLTRLRALAHLDEFERQFAYRTHGGYSDRLPNLLYQQKHPGGTDYEEAPGTVTPLFEETLLLRLRFSGWCLVQLATDPDPPSDEVGCTGTHMFHAADGDKRFDRAVLWQNVDPATTILREPREKLPPIGVNCVDLSLMVAGVGATAAYLPLPSLGPAGPLQSMPVQQSLEVTGLTDVLTITPKDIFGDKRQIRVDLKGKNGVPPFLNGFNHLVWQDGEPVDPFILSVSADPPADASSSTPDLLFEREVFNSGLSLMQMTPLQRIYSSRGPCGLSRNLTQIPNWASTKKQRQMILSPGYPQTYLHQRAAGLADVLSQRLSEPYDTQQGYDAVVSLAERLYNISFPLATTVNWLNFKLHYGHTVSGNMSLGAGNNPIIDTLSQQTNLQLKIELPSARTQPNSRWAVKYSMATMDTDALSAFVFGEVYVPLAVQSGSKPAQLTRRWSFPAEMSQTLAGYACSFANPFWAAYSVNDGTRVLNLPGGITITETLAKGATASSYSYNMSGISGITSFTGSLQVVQHDGRCELVWQVTFSCATPQSIVLTIAFVSEAAAQMLKALTAHFTPAS